jgi:hypothetical protein
MEERNQFDSMMELEGDKRTPESPALEACPWYITHKAPKAVLEVYPEELALHVPQNAPRSKAPPKREAGDIQVFSKKSRMRFLRMLHHLNKKRATRALFITLTARHGSMEPTAFRQAALEQWLPKVKALLCTVCYVWRLETHRDGYPHFHIMLWALDSDRDIHAENIISLLKIYWWKLVDDGGKGIREHSCKIDPMNDSRQVYKYICKYCAKVDRPGAPVITGRRWGRSTNFPDDPITRILLTPEEHLRLKLELHRVLKTKGEFLAQSSEYVMFHWNWWVWLDWQDIKEALWFSGIELGLKHCNWYDKQGISGLDCVPKDYLTGDDAHKRERPRTAKECKEFREGLYRKYKLGRYANEA